jgi:hypothetical protein
MHVVITIELMTIVSPISAFEHELIPMFSSIKKFKQIFKIEALLLLLSSLFKGKRE